MKKTSVLFIGNHQKFTENLQGKLKVTSLNWRQSGTLSNGLSDIRKHPADVIIFFNGSNKGSVQSDLISLRQKYPNIPVIIVSLNVSLMEAVEAMKNGAYDYIIPPFKNELIVSTIQKSINEFKMKHAAHFSSDMLSMLMENVPDIIYSLNPNGEFISLSPAVENTLGYRQAELLGTSVFDLIHPDDRERILTGFRESVEQGEQSVRTLQFRMKSKQGEIKDFEISRKLYFEEGKVVRNDGIARDISHRRNLERELRKYSEELEDRVKERTEKIEYAKSQLQALNEVSNKFAQIFAEDVLLEDAPKLLTESLDFDQAAIILKHEEKWLLKSYCFGKESPDLLKKYLDQMNKGKIPPPPYLEKCLTQHKAILIDNIEDLPGWSPEMQQSYKLKSLVAAPIRVRGEIIGIIEGDMVHHRRVMDSQDVARFEMFANMVGLALDNIRAYQDLEKRVSERTESLKEANKHLSLKAKEQQKASMDLAKANVKLLNIQEELQSKNEQMQKLITEISQNKDILQSILDSNMSAILMVDKNNKIVAVNRMIEILFQLIPAQLIGTDFTTFINRIKSRFKDGDKFTELIQNLIENPQESIEDETEMEELYRRAIQLKGKKLTFLSLFSSLVKDQTDAELGRVWYLFDITEMKQADEKLRAIVEASPIPFIISRQSDGKVLYANKPLADLIGVAPEEALESFTPSFYANPEDREIVIKKLTQSGFLSGHEIQIKRSDGSSVWMIMSLMPSEIEGEPVVIGALYDINERREAEEALMKERNFVSAILDTSGALVIVLNTDGSIIRFNRACELLTGWKFKEVKGKKFWDLFIIPEEKDIVEKTFNTLRAGNFPNSFENYWLARDGQKFQIAWSNTCLVNETGSVDFIIGTGIDITERKKAEEQLRLYREIFLNSNDGIAIFDPEGIFMERNPAHKKYTGYSDKEMINKKHSDIINMKNPDKIREELQKTGNFRGEVFGRVKNRRRVDLDLSIFSIYQENGEVNCYVGIARDITERKKAEVALQSAHDQLEKRVEERTRKLAELNETLREEIDERKQTEKALKEREEQVRALLNLIPDLMFHLDRDGTYLDYHAPAGSDLSVPREYVVGKKISETLPPDVAQQTHRGIRKALRSKETQIIEYQMSHNNEMRDFEARIVVSGKEEVLAIVRDITEQKQAKEALQKARDELEIRVKERTFELAKANDSLRLEISERIQAEKTLENRLKYEEGLASSSEILLKQDDMKIALTAVLQKLQRAADASRVYIFKNFTDDTGALNMQKICEAHAKGKSDETDIPVLQQLLYEPSLRRWKTRLNRGEKISGLIKKFPQKERTFLQDQNILSILILPITVNGQWYGFIGFDDTEEERVWDVDDIRLLQTAAEMIGGYIAKKQADQALSMSEERFRSLVENAHDIIYSMNPDGTFSYISPHFTKYTGYSVEEFLGRTLEPLVHPDDLNETERKMDFRIIHKNGDWKWFNLHSTPIRNEDGEIIETIGIAHDVTAMKTVLENLEKTNRELRSTQLKLIQSEKMASLGMLVAGIAHEINTPVGAIGSMHNTLVRATQKLKNEIIRNHPEYFEETKMTNLFKMLDDGNKVVKSASERVTDIVRRLRSFARLDEAELKEVDIHDGIEDTLTIVHHEIKHTVTVIKNFGKIPKIYCYPGQLNQVFLNLIINSKQAIGDKGEITITTFTKANKVYVQIKDNGKGIPQNKLDFIFDPGFTTKGVGVGTGLGLSIVYQIIQDHHGEITVESEPGKGTLFTISLPENLKEIVQENNTTQS